MKQIIYLLMFLFLVSSAFAEPVIIFNFNYNNGIVTLKNQIIKDGYYPDRNIEPIGGYSCKIIDEQGMDIYSFNFDLPPKLYTDATVNNTVIGGTIILSETDISFIAPYSVSAQEVVCYNPRGYEILRENIIRSVMSPQEKDRSLFFLWYIILAIIGFIILIYRTRKKSK